MQLVLYLWGACGVLVGCLFVTCRGIQIRLLFPLIGWINMQITITQVPLFTQKQVSEEALQIDRSIVNALNCVFIVRTHQRITEIPRMLGKHVVANLESYMAQIENRYGADRES